MNNPNLYFIFNNFVLSGLTGKIIFQKQTYVDELVFRDVRKCSTSFSRRPVLFVGVLTLS
jgi:hypothetical protein